MVGLVCGSAAGAESWCAVLTSRALARHVLASRQPLAVLLVLALLPFGLFGAETLGQQVFFHHDIQYYFYPYHKLVADTVASGALPLWNPYAFGGIPLLGDGQTAIFSPPNWLFFLLPAAQALTLVVLLQFSIAGTGAFLYVRSLGLGLWAATVAALSFMFSGFLVARVVHLSIMAGVAMIPLIFWSLERLIQEGNARRFALTALMVALQVVCGHPQAPIYTALAAGLYIVVLAGWRWQRAGMREAGAFALRLGGAYGAGYLLAAVQLVPWVEFARFSPRAAGASYGFVTDISLRGVDWLLWLLPYAYGGVRQSWLQSLPDWPGAHTYLWEREAYIGVLPLALAVLGLAELPRLRQLLGQRPRKQASPATLTASTYTRLQYERLWALVVVLVVMLLVTAGDSTPVGRFVYWLPVVGKLRGYGRAAGVAAFVLTTLAAYGTERLIARQRPASTQRGYDRVAIGVAVVLPTVVVGAVLSANLALGRLSEDPAAFQRYATLARALRFGNANASMPLILAGASAALLCWLARGMNWRNAWLVLGLIAVDVGGFAVTFNPVTTPEQFTRVPGSVAYLRGDPGLYRVATLVTDNEPPLPVAQDQLAISWALAYGVEEINGFNSLQPRRYTDLLFGPEVEDVSYGLFGDPAPVREDNRLLAMLDVKYLLVQRQARVTPGAGWTQVYADSNVTIYRNPERYGRAYFVRGVTVQPDAIAIRQAVRAAGFDPRQQAFVEDRLPLDVARQVSLASEATVDADSVQVTRVSPNELRLTTRASRARFLVLSEMWFPGWHAEIDGRETPLYRTNYLLRGLVVPAGEQTIRVYYWPGSLLLGAGVSLIAFVILAAAVVISSRRQVPDPIAAGTPEPRRTDRQQL